MRFEERDYGAHGVLVGMEVVAEFLHAHSVFVVEEDGRCIQAAVPYRGPTSESFRIELYCISSVTDDEVFE